MQQKLGYDWKELHPRRRTQYVWWLVQWHKRKRVALLTIKWVPVLCSDCRAKEGDWVAGGSVAEENRPSGKNEKQNRRKETTNRTGVGHDLQNQTILYFWMVVLQKELHSREKGPIENEEVQQQN